MSANPLNNSELYALAPSIFSDTAINTVSSQYDFVPTYQLLDTFRNAGYFPILAGEAKSRDSKNQPYVKHIIQFRSIENIIRPSAQEEYADIVLKNSHNKTSSFTLDLSYFRLVCSNLLTIPSEQLMYHRIIHKGFQSSKVERAIKEIVNYMPQVESTIEEWKQHKLNGVAALSLAKAAIDIRFDTSVHDVKPMELLKVNRPEDFNPTAWNIYNRVHESIINGGLQLKNKMSQKITTSKLITSIDEKTRLNKELFRTVQNLVALTSSPNLIAA